MAITDFTFSRHALERALEMGIDGEELRRCLATPTATHREHELRSPDTLYRGERIVCIVSPANVVKTVVWSNAESWQADLQRGGQGYNRRFDATEWQPR